MIDKKWLVDGICYNKAMFATVLTIAVTFCILVAAEYLARAKQVHAELTRKLVHVAVGSFVAFWPFFLTWRTIQLLSLAFFVVVCLSIKFEVFRSIHAVQRNIMGELLFAIVIGVLAAISPTPWVFTAAMLHLSLADGLAAVIGLGWGDTNSYKVLGKKKSIAGTTAFIVASYAILALFGIFSHSSTSVITLLWLPLVAAAAENVAVYGTDNLVMPLVVALVLSSGL
jgi:phytol kinase